MKKSLVLLLAILCPLTQAASASSTKSTHIKEWTTGGAKLYTRITPLAKKRLDNFTNYVILDTKATAQQGSTDKPNTFTAYDNVILANTSKEPRSIYLLISTCITKPGTQKSPDDFPLQCGTHTETVTLDPNDSQEFNINPEVTVNFKTPGDYQLITQIMAARIDLTDKNVQQIYTSDATANITVT